MKPVIAGISLMATVTVLAIGQTAPGFGTFRPDRGFMAYGSYTISDIESVNEANGGLTLSFPTASLPPGRGGFRHSIDLVYNSQLLALETLASPQNFHVTGCPGFPPDCPTAINRLTMDSGIGGWRYSFQYKFHVDERAGITGCSDPLTNDEIHRIKYSVTLPDGSNHLFRLLGSQDNGGDGYFWHDSNGLPICWLARPNATALSLPLKLHTTDGSYLQATVNRDTNNNLLWQVTLPDGRRVSGTKGYNDQICDRNDNCIFIQNSVDSDDKPLTELVDNFDRRIRIKYNYTGACPNAPDDCASSSDEIFQSGFGGTPSDPAATPNFTWKVNWTSSPTGSDADPIIYPCSSPAGGAYACKHNTSIRNVSSIELPTGGGTLRYSFLYADNEAPEAKRGWGELRTILLPNSSGSVSQPDTYRPRVEYDWKYQGKANDHPLLSLPATSRVSVLNADHPVVAKRLYRTVSIGGSTTNANESWTYMTPDLDAASPSGMITAPDGGVTTNYFFPRSSSYFAGLKWKTVSPQGAVIESYWQRNSPYIGTSAFSDKQNAFVKAEYRKPAGGSQYSATATTMDKNGSVLSATEYAFGVTVPRDTTSTRPNAVPSVGSILRKTTHAYHYESVADGETPTQPQLNAYWTDHTLRYKGARKRSIVYGAGGSTAESATDFAYDNAATTANLSKETKWDTPSSATTPATPAPNSTAADVTDYVWSQGNLTKVTDPDGDVTDVASM